MLPGCWKITGFTILCKTGLKVSEFERVANEVEKRKSIFANRKARWSSTVNPGKSESTTIQSTIYYNLQSGAHSDGQKGELKLDENRHQATMCHVQNIAPDQIR